MNTGDRNDQDPIERLQAGALAHRQPKKKRGCPNADRVRLLLSGHAPPREADELLTHAAECDWCGAVLRDAARDLHEPVTAEEEQLAAASRMADPVARRAFAARLASGRKDPGWWRPLQWWLPAAGLAAAALAGGVVYPQWVRSPAHTGRLLAQAYSKHRPMEMRPRNAAWGKLQTQMGAETSSFNQPPELLEAISNIKRGIDSNPNDPRWLQLEGRADLIGGKDAAISELERARALRPSDASILLDLGMAYFQKAEKSGDPKAYSQAYESFSDGLHFQPGDLTLLFDLALAAERIQTPDVARTEWENYLQKDSSGAWAAEARKHLDQVKKKLMDRAPTSSTPPPPR